MTSRRVVRVVGVSLAASAIGAAASPAAFAAPEHPSNSPKAPYAVHTLHKVGPGADAEVLSINRDANKACDKADHLFYSPPKKGYVYVVVQFEAKKLSGGRKQNTGDMIITNLIAKNGRQYGQLYGIVAPHDASSSKDVAKGGKSTGGFTYMVKKSDVKAGHLEVLVETTDASITPYYFKV